MDRREHLDWAIDRALYYVDNDQAVNGFTSLISDLGKHKDTAYLARSELLMHTALSMAAPGGPEADRDRAKDVFAVLVEYDRLLAIAQARSV